MQICVHFFFKSNWHGSIIKYLVREPNDYSKISVDLYIFQHHMAGIVFMFPRSSRICEYYA